MPVDSHRPVRATLPWRLRPSRPLRALAHRLSILLTFMLGLWGVCVACVSHPRGRSGADQVTGNVADAATLAAASVVARGGNVPIGNVPLRRAGARHVARLEIFVSGMTCPRLTPRSIALRITDLTDRSVVAEGLQVRSDWKVGGEIRLLRGPHELALVDVTKNRVIATRTLDYDGAPSWHGAVEVACDGESVSFLGMGAPAYMVSTM